MSDNQTRQITEPIYYDDAQVIHARESAIMHPGARLAWTLCDFDVPDGLALPHGLAEIDLTRARQCTRSGADPGTDRCTGQRGTNQRTTDSTGGCADARPAQCAVTGRLSARGQGEQEQGH